MAKPTEKAPEIDKAIKDCFGVDRKGAIESDICALCGESAKNFTDNLSRREYEISGMCQKCQDEIF